MTGLKYHTPMSASDPSTEFEAPQQIVLGTRTWHKEKELTLWNRNHTRAHGRAALYTPSAMATLQGDVATSNAQERALERGEYANPPGHPMGIPEAREGEPFVAPDSSAFSLSPAVGDDGTTSSISQGDFIRQALGAAANSLSVPPEGEGTPMLLLGYDTEYTDERLVSVQFYTDSAAVIFYVEPMPRGYMLELQTYLQTVFELIEVPNWRRYGSNEQPPMLDVTLVAHFAVADLSQFGFRRYDPLRLVRKCGSGYASIDPDWTVRPIKLHDSSRHKCWRVRLRYRDTMSLCDGGSLGELGVVVGFDKVTLPEGSIKHMDALLGDDPKLFTEYAISDAVIAHDYAAMLLCDGSVPVSASAMASRYLKGCVNKTVAVPPDCEATPVDSWRGLRPVKVEGLQSSDCLSGGLHYMKKSGYEPCCFAAREIHDYFSRAYRGGLNQCYSHGWEPSNTYDLDLCNAYPTMLACVPDIDYWTPPKRSERLNLTLSQIGDPWIPAAGVCDIELPPGCIFPPVAVPARVGTSCGLVTPRKLKEVYITTPEAYAVLAMGGSVFAHVWIEPVLARNNDGSVRYTMMNVMRDLVVKRSIAQCNFGKKSVADRTLKLIANSMYGKLAQGLQESTGFDSGLKISTPKPISSVTNVVLAAMATACPRAFLSLLMQCCHESGHDVYSVTTDGFISTATADEAMRCVSVNPPTARWASYIETVRRELTADANPVWLEQKHHNPDGFMNVATRINIAPNVSGVAVENGVCAHTGYKSDYADKSVELRQEIIEKVISRQGPVDTFTKSASSLRDLVSDRSKPLAIARSDKKVSLDYDFKRKPVNPSTREFSAFGNDYEYLHFSTEPFESLAEYERFKRAALNRKSVSINSVARVLSVEAAATGDSSLASQAKMQSQREKKLSRDQQAIYAVRAWSRGYVELPCGKRCETVEVPDGKGGVKSKKEWLPYEMLGDFLARHGYDIDEKALRNACRADKNYLPPYDLFEDCVTELGGQAVSHPAVLP